MGFSSNDSSIIRFSTTGSSLIDARLVTSLTPVDFPIADLSLKLSSVLSLILNGFIGWVVGLAAELLPNFNRTRLTVMSDLCAQEL